MCRHHWRSVGAELRKAVNATWKLVSRDTRAGRENFEARLAHIRRYRAATAAAITFIIEKEGLHAQGN